MAVNFFYVKSGAGAIVLANRAWSTGEKMVPLRSDASSNFAVARRWVWECTTAGTSNGTPTWGASVTQDVTTVTQNGVVWTARKPGFSSGTTADWTFSGIYCDYVLGGMAAGDTMYVSNNHAETSAGANVTWTSAGTVSSPIKVLCVDDAATPPTAAAITANVTVTGNGFNLTINGSIYVYGILFHGGTSTEQTNISMDNNGAVQMFDTCLLEIVGTNSNARISFPAGPNGGNVVTMRWRKVDVKFSSTGHAISFSSTILDWDGGSILAGSAAITNLFGMSSSRAGIARISGVDLSAGATALYIFSGTGGIGMVRKCKMPASWSGDLFNGTPSAGCEYTMDDCDNGATNYRKRFANFAGSLREETTLVRTSGASNGTTANSWKIVTSANCNDGPGRFYTPEMPIWNTTTGATVTTTLPILRDSASNLTDAEVGIEVLGSGSSATPLGTIVDDRRADPMVNAADQSSSALTWTTTGMSNPNKQELAKGFTAQLVGYVVPRGVITKASTTLYLDTLPVLT